MFFDRDRKPIPILGKKGANRKPGSKTLEEALKCSDAKFLDFLQHCFMWEPERRITPEEALRHPWVTQEETAKARLDLDNSSDPTQLNSQTQKTREQQKPESKSQSVKKEKIGLNKTLAYPNSVLKAKPEDNKSQDKLMRFKEMLRMAREQKTGNENGKEGTFLYSLFKKSSGNYPATTKNKQLKQSNIF